MPSYDNPARTLALLRELEGLGFPEAAFSLLHHFEKPATIASHRRYCEGLKEEDARFRTNTNRLVQRRLEIVLNLYRAGEFTNRAPALFEHLARAALIELPHEKRQLNEQ
jgi:hypothetical protein